MDKNKTARVSWTTETRGGKATRHCKEISTTKLKAFLAKLADKDVYQIDVVYSA